MQPQSTGKCEAGGPVDAVYMLSKGGLLAQPNACCLHWSSCSAGWTRRCWLPLGACSRLTGCSPSRSVWACTLTRVPCVLDQAMQAPIEGMQQAHGLLSHEERMGWAKGLDAAGLCVGDTGDELHLYLGGRLSHGDQMSGGLDH